MPINLLELLDGLEFPATKTEIVDYAQDQGASEEALDMLQALPHEEYKTLTAFNRDHLLIGKLPGSDMNMFSSSQSQ